MGVDPNLAFMGVCAVAIAGLGFGIHTVRDILERLLNAERAADKAKAEVRLLREENAYGRSLEKYQDTLTRYEEAVAPKPGPRIDWKATTDGR